MLLIDLLQVLMLVVVVLLKLLMMLLRVLLMMLILHVLLRMRALQMHLVYLLHLCCMRLLKTLLAVSLWIKAKIGMAMPRVLYYQNFAVMGLLTASERCWCLAMATDSVLVTLATQLVSPS